MVSRGVESPVRRARAVLDANVVLSALLRPAGPPGSLLKQAIHGRSFELVVSDSILEEIRRALEDPKVRKHVAVPEEDLHLWIASLELLAAHVDGNRKVRVVTRDPEDNKYIAAALEGGARFIISNDPHLLGLREYRGIQMATPRGFLELLELEGETQ